MGHIVLYLGHALPGRVTTVNFPYGPDHADLQVLREADHGSLNPHSQRMRNWLLSLPDEHQPYFTHIIEADQLWWNENVPFGTDLPPVWVSCPGHPAFEEAVARHF